MEEKELFALQPARLQALAAAQELRDCNRLTARFGLTLSEEQIQELVECRVESLRGTGRVELEGGILKKLVDAFFDSPYLTQEDYADTLAELQDSFYYFKNESMDRIPDDDLIHWMRLIFDGKAQGSLDYLCGTSLEELCRAAREEFDQGWG